MASCWVGCLSPCYRAGCRARGSLWPCLFRSCCEPLAGLAWWKKVKEKRQEHDQRDGSGRMGEAVRAPAQGLHCVRGWALAAGLTPGLRQGPEVQKLADIMFFRDSCFKNSEGFFICYFASVMNGHLSVNQYKYQECIISRFLHFSWKTLQRQRRGHGAAHDTLTHTLHANLCPNHPLLSQRHQGQPAGLSEIRHTGTVSSKSYFLGVTDTYDFIFYWSVIQ